MSEEMTEAEIKKYIKDYIQRHPFMFASWWGDSESNAPDWDLQSLMKRAKILDT